MVQNNKTETVVESILGKKSIIELAPIIIKKKDLADKICYFFDTDENASPFDINMAYDAGFDIVVPVSKEKIAKEVIKSLVPPFECPVIIDPRGSHTTASAVVAMTIDILSKKHGITNIEGKKVVIFGAGPVARIAAILASKTNCQTYIVETWDKSNENFIINLAKELSEETGQDYNEIKGIFAPESDQRLNICKDADIIWCLAAAGVEILSDDSVKTLKGKKIIVDINLVPPYGIEGIKPKYKNEEIYPEIFAIGALALGKLKADSEAQILKEAANTKGLKIFNYEYAFEVAKGLLKK